MSDRELELVTDTEAAEKIARAFHDAYERAAPMFGYQTQVPTRLFDPESPNGRLMRHVAAEVIGPLLAERERLKAEVAAEREACAKLAESLIGGLNAKPMTSMERIVAGPVLDALHEIAAAIRARVSQ